MGGTDGKVLGSRSIHFKLARLLIAFIADDIIQLLCKYIYFFTAGADTCNYWGRSKSGSTSEQFYIWTRFLRNEV